MQFKHGSHNFQTETDYIKFLKEYSTSDLTSASTFNFQGYSSTSTLYNKPLPNSTGNIKKRNKGIRVDKACVTL